MSTLLKYSTLFKDFITCDTLNGRNYFCPDNAGPGWENFFFPTLRLWNSYKNYRTLVLGLKDRTEAESQFVTEYIRE